MFARIIAAAGLALASLSAPAQEAAPTCGTFITSLPYTISAPGYYCLKQNLQTDVMSIQILSDDVVLNCRGKTITNTTRSQGSDGIAVFQGTRNVTVQGCTVRDFDRGISVFSSGGNISVLNNHVDGAISNGIQAGGNDIRIANNRVTNVHGQQPTGIYLVPQSPEVSATGQEVINNVIANVYGGQINTGIAIGGSTAPRITNNHIIDIEGNNETSFSVAFWLMNWAQGATTTGVEMINNTVTSRVPGMGGIWGQPQLCRGNVSVGLPGAFSGCLTSFDTTDIP
jgi:hypothetical protein